MLLLLSECSAAYTTHARPEVANRTWRVWSPEDGPTAADATAVCIAGQLRSLPWLLDNLDSAVLTPVQPAGVFVQASPEWTPSPHELLQAGDALLTTAAMIEAIIKRLRPVGVLVQTDAALLRTDPSGAPTSCRRSSCPALLQRFTGCAHDIEKHETQHRELPYRWVLRTRPDLLWSCQLPLPTPPADAGAPPLADRRALLINDLFGLYPRALGMRMLRLLETVAVERRECRGIRARLELHCCQGELLVESKSHVCTIEPAEDSGAPSLPVAGELKLRGGPVHLMNVRATTHAIRVLQSPPLAAQQLAPSLNRTTRLLTAVTSAQCATSCLGLLAVAERETDHHCS